MSAEPHCGGCRHFTLKGRGNLQAFGECRRNAPQARTDGGPDIPASWPRVLELDSCGEFAAKGAAGVKAPPPPPPVPEAPPTKVMREGDVRARTPRSTTKGGARRAKR